MNDEFFMSAALHQAELAAENNEVPVGAVIAKENNIIASAFNHPIGLHDPTAHAEVLVLREAAKKIGNYRLVDTTLYVTLEPCMMCVGAMVHARVARVVFGASDPKSGALGGVCNGLDLSCFNHRFEFSSNVLADPCGAILKDFFKERR